MDFETEDTCSLNVRHLRASRFLLGGEFLRQQEYCLEMLMVGNLVERSYRRFHL